MADVSGLDEAMIQVLGTLGGISAAVAVYAHPSVSTSAVAWSPRVRAAFQLLGFCVFLFLIGPVVVLAAHVLEVWESPATTSDLLIGVAVAGVTLLVRASIELLRA